MCFMQYKDYLSNMTYLQSIQTIATNTHALFWFNRSCLTRIKNVIVEGVMLDKIEFQTVIRFLHLQCKTAQTIYKEMSPVYED